MHHQDGKAHVKRVAKRLIRAVALPVGFWDDVSGNRFHLLGRLREKLVQLSREEESEDNAASASSASASASAAQDAECSCHCQSEPAAPESAPEPTAAETLETPTTPIEAAPPEAAPPEAGPAVEMSAEQAVPTEKAPEPVKARVGAMEQADVAPSLLGEAALEGVSEGVAGGLQEPEAKKEGEAPVPTVEISELFRELDGSLLSESDLPLPNYDKMNAHRIIESIRILQVDRIPVILAYEQAHKARKSIHEVGMRRLERAAAHGQLPLPT